jgi:predicted RecB family nuclease
MLNKIKDLSFQSTLTMENNGLTHPLITPQGTTTSIASIKPEKVFSVPLIIQISINYQIL